MAGPLTVGYWQKELASWGIMELWVERREVEGMGAVVPVLRLQAQAPEQEEEAVVGVDRSFSPLCLQRVQDYFCYFCLFLCAGRCTC